ncbi:MAG: hypothetical protein ACLRWA_02295 [Lachnospira sp.]
MTAWVLIKGGKKRKSALTSWTIARSVTAILHENGYTVGPRKEKKTETGKQFGSGHFESVRGVKAPTRQNSGKTSSGKTVITQEGDGIRCQRRLVTRHRRKKVDEDMKQIRFSIPGQPFGKQRPKFSRAGA